MNIHPADLVSRLSAIVGPRHALTDPADQAPYLSEPRGLWHGRAAVVLRPGSVREVSEILRLAHETAAPVVPQSGNTGLVGGQTPDDSGTGIVLSLDRLDRIRKVDPQGCTMTAEAGVILADAQAAAEEADRLFPLSLAAEGSCRIGGNLATNAGGTGVLVYGNIRDLTLGLEVVLADGRVWNGLRALRKDNTGYDLKNLFIGSEGTLGVITAAVLKLFPRPRVTATALAGVADPAAALTLFALARGHAGPQVTACELISRTGLEFVLRHGADTRDPLAAAHPFYVLLELTSPLAGADLRSLLETILMAAHETGAVNDAAIAESLAQQGDFWRLRELLSEVQRHEGGSIKHDISVPLPRIPEFIARACGTVGKIVPGCRPIPFGHIGDGNVHFNVSQPIGADKAAFLARWEEVSDAVHEIVLSLGGSISAEHGIGRLKRARMEAIKDPVELEMMRGIKRTLDPRNILNPGVLV
jgi:FAD/FMN-containing dehydrogenase